MTDRVRALLAEAPGLELASQIAPARLPVPEALESILPLGGLRLGTTVGITGIGATSLGLALVSRASRERWTAVVGLSNLSLPAAAELSVDLDRLVVVPDPGDQWTHTLAAVIDAFDVVLIGGQHGAPRTPRLIGGQHGAPRTPRLIGGQHGTPRTARKISARVREQDAVLIAIGGWPESDLSIRCVSARWDGLGQGYGHLRTRTIDVSVDGRGSAACGMSSTLLLPDEDGTVALYSEHTVVALRR